MSKQLIHSHKSHVVVAALNNRAFALVANKKDSTSHARAFELLPPAAFPSNGSNGEKLASNAEDADEKKGSDVSEGVVDKSEKDESKKKNQKSKNKPATTDATDEIQAVCCTEIESHNWFAVSRQDKTLCLYCAPSLTEGSDVKDKQKAKHLHPLAIYNMPKRARCLVFSTVPSSNNEGCNIIIAGDLSGDSYAYPLPKYSCDTSTAATANSPRRLLLGHTASILTGMSVSPSSSNKQFILTADRDEKVRVSKFPETHVIHGYLLGHSAFISAMDAVSGCEDGEVRTLCLTGSGDGTVRLWDYQSCKEIGMVPVVLREDEVEEEDNLKKEDELKVEEDVKESEENECDEEENEDESVELNSECSGDEEEEDYNGLMAVPLAVAISSDSSYAVVARDGISSIDIHPIPNPSEKKSSNSLFLSQLISLHKKQTLTCPSQPLDICLLSDGSVLVLAREPEYILHFKHSDLVFRDVTSTSPFCSLLASIAKEQKISMPLTTLEYNDDGTLKLQKKLDNKEFQNDDADIDSENASGKAGLHWNDKKRRNTHRLANHRRKKRKSKRSKNGDE